MDLMLQVWGGSFFLVSKMLFALAEGKPINAKSRLKVIGWSIYILGVPAWVIILLGNHNWIAASIEAGGIPAMLLGLYLTYKHQQKPHESFSVLVIFCTYTCLAFGLMKSLAMNGAGLSITQIMELGVMAGFLLGNYYMAKSNPCGWLFFMLMNISMASLMYLQQNRILMAQQLLSLCFVCYGFMKTRKPNIEHEVELNHQAII
jgi:hypothetical protein